MTHQAYHPTGEQLIDYSRGMLATGQSVAISAHIELCDRCRQVAADEESRSARVWLETPEAVSSDRFYDMLDGITLQPQTTSPAVESFVFPELHMLERSVTLPRVLAKASSAGLVWKKVSGSINQASVKLDDETQCNFLYMKAGGRIPLHKHQGYEITLVLDGSFRDESGHYRKGDFILRKGDQAHTPVSDEGCLCFTVIDAPLTFTAGLARLLNPINRYLFNRDISQRVGGEKRVRVCN